jgi:hypothetical protein
MSPIEPIGAAASARNAPSHGTPASARSGAERVQSVQSHGTARAAAPIETAEAVRQVQTAEHSRMPATHPPKPARAPIPPMTAVILHELRLQQELADLQVKKEETAG